MGKMRGVGTKLKLGESAIGGLTSIGGIEITAETIDTTDLSSDGGYREFIGGFKDGGEVGLEGSLDDTAGSNQQAVYDALESGAVTQCKIEFPNGGSWTFSAVVTKFATNVDLEDKIGFSASLKVSGKPVFVLKGTPTP